MLKSFILGVMTVILCSCVNTAVQPTTQNVEPSEPNLFDYSYKACDLLLQRATATIDRQRDVLVASFVNTDRLDESSTFGRCIADNYITYLVLQGYKVSEIKLRENVLVKQDAGEFMLSREVKNILTTHKVHAVLVGTYSVGAENVYVTAKVINPADSVIISAVDYKIKMTRDVRKMLGMP
ncbi:FlgO family outer membrane protein [Desulfolutivibrio sulfoxidireducens]|uniref:FlgO family outer membrane protein n=1 Tax=Desulfolutivibrio sulfoxidireducens TaxID=2773299 RepID=UPI00159D0C29|nr:FlgO family outer membrane protein [Desulfolutivibrio sulfoxidireducens]QLA15417.1 hypothetical protein GD605_04310 [Desulfolutivibrio sulfoxidireducens]